MCLSESEELYFYILEIGWSNCYKHKWKQPHIQDKILISTNHNNIDYITNRLGIIKCYYDKSVRDRSC